MTVDCEKLIEWSDCGTDQADKDEIVTFSLLIINMACHSNEVLRAKQRAEEAKQKAEDRAQVRSTHALPFIHLYILGRLPTR